VVAMDRGFILYLFIDPYMMKGPCRSKKNFLAFAELKVGCLISWR